MWSKIEGIFVFLLRASPQTPEVKEAISTMKFG
jgi:hypothetical protein